jgi:hypothetical protein
MACAAPTPCLEFSALCVPCVMYDSQSHALDRLKKCGYCSSVSCGRYNQVQVQVKMMASVCLLVSKTTQISTMMIKGTQTPNVI